MATIIERKGKKQTTYTARVRIVGCPQSVKTFRRKTDAENWAKKMEARKLENRDFPEKMAGKRTVKDAIIKYKEECFGDKPGSKDKQTMQLTWWQKAIGHIRLASLTPEIICEARSKLQLGITRSGKPRKNATVNRYKSALSAVLTATVSRWHWLPTNPVRQIPQLPEGPGRTRFLNRDELLRLTKACQQSRNKLLLALFLLAIATGLRKSEALNLKWCDIDFTKRTVYVRQSKNDEPRALPLEGPVLAELHKVYKHRRTDSKLVFPGQNPNTPMDFSTAWKNALARSGVRDFRWHDNRHTTGSYLAMSGATIAEIAEILGHKTIAVAKRYAHHSVEHKRVKLITMNQSHIPEDLISVAETHKPQN